MTVTLTSIIVTPAGVAERVNQLRLARKQAGLTQVELADLAGVSVFTIARYERNGRLPLTREFVRVVAALSAAQMRNGSNGGGAA